MSRERVLVDTGVLVAAFAPRDRRHELCKRAILQVNGQACTVLAVIVELAHLMRRDGLDVAAALSALARAKSLLILDIGQQHFEDIASWLKKYDDQRPDFADACLMHAAHVYNIKRILTLDKEFRIYRTQLGRPLQIEPSNSTD